MIRNLMKSMGLYFVIGCLCLVFNALTAQTIYFEGINSGKNVVIYNPLSMDNLGTCIQRIMVNGDIYPFNISDNYIEVNLSSMDIKQGSFFYMEIECQAGCKPFIYNEQDFGSSKSNVVVSAKLVDNLLTWKTDDELLNSSFIIEMKYREKWVFVAKVASKAPGSFSYDYKLPFLLSGITNIRLKKVNVKQDYVYLAPVKNNNQKFSLSANITHSTIYLLSSGKPTLTYYQLLDQNQVMVQQGIADKVDFKTLKTGIYTLYYDDKSSTVLRQ